MVGYLSGKTPAEGCRVGKEGSTENAGAGRIVPARTMRVHCGRGPVVAWEKASQVGVGRSTEAHGGGHAVSRLGGDVALASSCRSRSI